jgi:hypothetical protein
MPAGAVRPRAPRELAAAIDAELHVEHRLAHDRMHEAQLVAPAVVVAAVGEDVPDDERIDRVGRRCGSIRSRPAASCGSLRPSTAAVASSCTASSRSRDSSAGEIVAGPRPEIAEAVAGSSGARPRASILHQLAGEKTGCRRWPRAAPRAPPARGRRRHARPSSPIASKQSGCGARHSPWRAATRRARRGRTEAGAWR